MPDIAPDKKDPVSLPSQDWVFSTCSLLCQDLLHQDLFCQSHLDILLQEPSPMQSGTSCSIFSKSRLGSLHHSLLCKVQHRIFFCQSQLDILLQEPSPMQSGTSCSIFSKSRLGSLHHSLLCKVQHGPPSAVARAPKVKTKLSAPGSSSHNSARPGSSVN